MYYIGLMSGTSMDALDVALVEFENKANLKFYQEYPIDPSLRKKIRSINGKSEIGHIAELDNELGHLFARAVNDLLTETNINAEQIIAIGSHGQTILHKPNGKHATSIQISNPNIISAETGITTVADFRRMDMAYGGQGAPLASAFHQYQFQQNNKTTVILNIGGIANITLLSNNDVIGFDTGPGNALLDDWIQHNQSKEYDKDSEWAREGTVNKELLNIMLSENYFALPSPKSTGREYFNLAWLNTYIKKIDSNISPADIQATLLRLSAITISDSINASSSNINEVLICGGGAYNPNLMDSLQNLLPSIDVTTTAKYGLEPDCIEAVTFAWLAKQRIEKKSSNLPSVTGARKAILLGGIYSAN